MFLGHFPSLLLIVVLILPDRGYHALTCQVPDKPGQGSYTPGTHKFYFIGSTIKYHCNAGYALIGSKTRKCLDTGEWSGAVPMCKVVSKGKPLEELTGYHVMGGTHQRGIRTAKSCLSACAAKPECTSVDFNFAKRGCWHHTSLCAQVKAKKVVTHYRFVTCALKYHQKGGQRQSPYRGNVAACVAGCRRSSTCLSVDYNHVTKGCYFHKRETVCSDLCIYKDVTNYALMRCA